MSEGPNVLVVDNYDSFVYNIVQYLAELGATVEVARNDAVDDATVGRMDLDGVLVSPGPGHPRDAGNCIEIIRYCAEVELAMLGVCLGHQALAEAFGARVVGAPELLHGRSSLVEHDGTGLYAGVSDPLVAGRYHSLVVDEATLTEDLLVTARSNGLVMGLAHRSLPLSGVQFHPESVLTQDGYRILANWLAVCGSVVAQARVDDLTARIDSVRSALPRPAR